MLRRPGSPRHVALLALLVIAVGIVVSVRLVNDEEASGIVASADPRIVIGFAGDPQVPRDREVLRGLRVWTRMLEQTTRGIPYAPRRIAAVTVQLPRSDAVADPAGAARELLRRGATVLVGPADARRAAEVVEVVREERDALLLSPIRRASNIRRIPQAFFLARPNPYEFQQVYDVFALRRRGSANRFVVLTALAPWPVEGRNAVRAARTRGFTATLVEVRNGDVDAALGEVDLTRQSAILVTAPVATGLKWFERARNIPGASRLPWVLGARDVPAGALPPDGAGVAVSVPWSPTSTQGTTSEVAALYNGVYGTLATTDAAAGTTLGLLLADAAARAQSTVGIRLQRTLARADLLTPWGQIEFREGEQEPAPPAQVVLAHEDGPRGIWPFPQAPQLLRRSIPAALERSGGAAARTETAGGGTER